MAEFKGTKGLKILHSNELGFSLGDNEHNTRITFWRVDSETKANILMMLKAPEMLEILKELTELKSSSFLLDELQDRAKQLIKEATEF